MTLDSSTLLGLFALALLLVALAIAGLGAFVLRRRPAPGSRAFAVAMAGIALWSATYALELLDPALAGKLVWARWQYFGAAVVTVSWLVFAMQAAGLGARLGVLGIAALAMVPASVCAVAWSPSAIPLLWSEIEMRGSGALALLHAGHGPLFWVFTLYSYALVIGAGVLLITSARRLPSLYRNQKIALVAGSVAPLLGDVLYISDTGPIGGLDFAPFAFAASGALFAWSLFRLRSFDLVPVARELIVENMEDPILVLDERGRVVDLNPAAARIFGRRDEELIGLRTAESLPGYPELDLSAAPFDVRKEIVIGSGAERRWFDLESSALRPPGGSPSRRLVVLRDLSERKAMEEALRESESNYRTILENIEEGYFDLDLGGSITSCNDVLAKIVGYPRQTAIGLNFRQYTDSETASRLKAEFLRVYETGETLRELNHDILRPDGTVASVELAAMLVRNADGTPIAFRGLVRDVSERKRAEAALQEAQERISRLLAGSPGPAQDLQEWVTAVCREVVAGIGAERIGVWEVEADHMAALGETDIDPPSANDLRAQVASVGAGLVETGQRVVVPVTTTAGDVCGAVVVMGALRAWGPTEHRVLAALARQLGAALEMRRLRRQLAVREERRAVTRREMKERGVVLLAVCPRCERCYPDTLDRCEDDGAGLEVPRALPYTMLERYRFLRVLGAGGMGTVLAALDERLGREVAIKLVRADHFHSADLRRRFEAEARTVARIQHPNVIAIFDSGELADGTAFLVVEKLTGANVAQTLDHHGSATPAQAAALVEQASSALAAAHRLAVVHRDIKPANLFLIPGAGGPCVKVLDFGIAKSAASQEGLTETGIIVGTPAYMSPEQLQGSPVDARTDVYALACVAYEVLCGERAARGENIGQILVSALAGGPPSIRRLLPAMPAEVDEILAHGMAKEARERAPDIEAWGKRLSAALATLEPGGRGWPPDWPASRAQPPRPAPIRDSIATRTVI